MTMHVGENEKDEDGQQGYEMKDQLRNFVAKAFENVEEGMLPSTFCHVMSCHQCVCVHLVRKG